MVTPIKPMTAGKLWAIWESPTEIEFMCSPETAEDFIQHGMVVDGKRRPVHKIDEWPALNAWQIGVITA